MGTEEQPSMPLRSAEGQGLAGNKSAGQAMMHKAERKNGAVQPPKIEEVLQKLAACATDPLHKRLIQAYKGPDPFNAVVAEFSKILNEVARGET